MRTISTFLLLATCFLQYLVLTAQTTFGPQQVITKNETDGASSVYAADLDGDGDLDLLSASSKDNKIAWYENDGLGNFGTQQVISSAVNRASFVYAVDLDGDGDLDVLSASYNDGKIAWHENDGVGNFGAQQIITTAVNYANSVYATDLDGDGDVDVLSASWNDNKIAWYENDGAGNFGAQQIITTAAYYAWSVYAADLDGDGDLDVLSASAYDDKIAWYANDGAGNFGTQQIITTAAEGATFVYAADLDGDGDADVLTNLDNNLWYENDGLGNFVSREFGTNLVSDYSILVLASDMDGDGDLDVISTDGYINFNIGVGLLIINDIIWYENDGLGNFVAKHNIGGYIGLKSVYVADLDGDGDGDVLSASYDDSMYSPTNGSAVIVCYKNDGAGNFLEKTIITPVAYKATSVYSADLDGDGDIDVLSVSGGNKIAWYENDGAGNFSTQKVIANATDVFSILKTVDVDGDGDIDVLSASYTNNKIAWYENDGAGNFGTQQTITIAANGINSVFTADLDGDGDIDVLLASAYDNKIAWLENDGVGNFGSQQIITSVVNVICAVYAADLDGDGDLDVLSNSQHQIVWFENDGVGNFGAQQIIFLSSIGCSVFIEDMDLDGDIDITAQSSGKLIWFENDGLGNFAMKQPNLSYDYNDNATYYAVDLDSDDDIDIIRTTNFVFVDGSGYHLSSAITWAENEGMGNFSPHQYITTAVKGILSVCTDDLDGDGDLDVLSASLLDDKIAWYENLLYNPRISGKVFYDANQNGILESTEFGIPFQSISVEPESLYTYANNNSFFIFYYQTAGTYTLNYTVPDNWSATTPTSYTVTLAEGQASLNHNFGIYPNTLVTEVKPYLTSGINRCNWQVPYHLSIVNEGTTIVPVSVICLQLDQKLSYINAIPMPDSIGTQGWLYWHVSNFLPAQQTQITVLVQEPDFTAMGDTLFNNVIVESYDSNEQRTGLNSFAYTPLVTCSYDPNDKQVTPSGIKEQNYTLIGQELFYTIRFQNTGNDTAFNVIIADTLSAWVNHHTFRIINSSHPMQTKRYSNGLVEFYFKNIMLPDSTVNEPGSHGYILYAVQLVANLPNNTPIANTAYIYFDQNPAIVTNTVKNTMVYELPIDQNSANNTGISLVALTPNPTQNTATLTYTTAQPTQPTTLHLYDLTGRLLFKTALQPTAGINSYVLDMTRYPTGVYVVTLNSGAEVVTGKVVRE